MKETVEWLHTEEMAFHTYIWTHETKLADKVFLLIHGSVEHAKRYEAFAKVLVDHGYKVIAPDLRGHGQTAVKAGNLGHFSDGPMGWELCVHDIKIFYDYIRRTYPEAPIVLFGHSMGSYLVRTFIKEYPVDLAGVIISGTGGFAKGIGDMGIWLAKLIMHIKGRAYKSVFLTKLVYDSLNKRVGQVKTPFDFLSRDEQIVKAYIDDPLCGYTCSAEFIHEMLLGTKKCNQEELFQLKNKDLPLLLISGKADPVGDKGAKGIKSVHKNYQKYHKEIRFHLYEGARHELLNEVNKEDVINDILKWLSCPYESC